MGHEFHYMDKIYARNNEHAIYLNDTYTWLYIPWRITTTKRHVIWVKLTLFTGLWFSGRARLDATQNQPVFWYQIYTTKLRAYAYTQSDLKFVLHIECLSNALTRSVYLIINISYNMHLPCLTLYGFKYTIHLCIFVSYLNELLNLLHIGFLNKYISNMDR